MKLKFLLLFYFLLVLNAASAQKNLTFKGKIFSKETQEPVPGALVMVKNTQIGTTADASGFFELSCIDCKLPLVLIFKNIGFKIQEYTALSEGEIPNIYLENDDLLSEQVVVSASRVEEKILQSPVAIQKVDLQTIKENPAPSFYDVLENVKGVQLTTSSLTLKVPNSRGFNAPNNFRFMQLVDGVDVQAATLGVPLGNAIGPTELDILSVEVTPGAASALYGMNAVNGLAALQTKNPFYYQGFSFYQRLALNHVDGIDHAPALFSETAFRFAKAFNQKFAFKLNASYLKGTDWVSNTLTDQNSNDLPTANPTFQELSGEDNPASDLWNVYGDERNNRTTVTVNYQGRAQTFNVSRTGYSEKQLVEPTVQNIKADAALYYNINKDLQLSYSYRFGQMDGIFQRGNKIRLQGVTVQNHKLQLDGKKFIAKIYASLENTGKSYNLKPLADNLDLNNGSNSQWAARFRNALQSEIDKGIDLQTAFAAARLVADEGRVEPGTEAFEALKDSIIGTNNWDIAANVSGAPATGGAWLKQASAMYHGDFQYNLSDEIKFMEVLIGADYRLYAVIPDGNNFVDFSRPIGERTAALEDGSFGENQYYMKVGAFVQASKRFWNDKLKVNASLRADYNPEFSPKLNPRIALVYSPQQQHNFRISYQNGWRFPALFEAFSFVNNGNVRRVGGLARVNEGLGYLENSYTLASVDLFNAAVKTDVNNGYTQTDAALRNKNILLRADLPALQPENVNAFDFGYKAVLFKNRLFIDLDIYANSYRGFLGQVEVAVPKSGEVGSDSAVLDMLTRSKQVRYRVFTNSRNTYWSYGSALGLTFNFYKKFTLNANLSYNELYGDNKSDIFITAFNTPRWTTNIGIGNKELFENFGFNILWRRQSAFRWESPLANGTVPAFNTLDAQVNYRIKSLGITLKAGGTNLLNRRYIQYAAGPSIGGFYYLTLTFDASALKK